MFVLKIAFLCILAALLQGAVEVSAITWTWNTSVTILAAFVAGGVWSSVYDKVYGS